MPNGSTRSALRYLSLAATLLLATLLLAAPLARAQGLKTIDNPGGGQLVYGPMDDQTTPQAAMVSVLRLTHTHFGGRPQVGTIFQSTDHQTYGAYFTLTASTQGSRAVAGLVLIDMSHGSAPEAAVMYDDAGRFARTEPAMVHTLSAAWNSLPAATATTAAAGHLAPPQPLRMQSGGDGSAKIGLPADWHITAVAGGAITAEGPHGEQVARAVLYQNIHDPNLKSNLQRFSGANAPDAIAYPIGGNVFNAYASLTNQLRRIHHQPPATFTYISSLKPDITQNSSSTQVIFDVDLQDGKGPRSASARIIENFYPNSPTWMMSVDTSSIPKAYVDAEQQTVYAIINSFGQDAGVINGELQTSLANTRAIGVRSAQQAADADVRRVASTAAFNQRMDDLSIASKVQQNRTMDRTELQDNKYSERGAIDNNVAAALIRANPDRYQEVPTASFLKGVDY